jgi:hypothetical protein
MLMLASNLLAERAFSLDGRAMYNAFPTAFTPAPYTFAIWGLIFVGCIALTIQMGFRPTGSEARLDFLAWCVALAFFLNATTPFTPIGVSNLVLGAMIVALGLAYKTAVASPSAGLGFVWFVRMPLAMFLTWIVVAFILNGCQFAVSRGMPVGEGAGIILMLLAAAFGTLFAVGCREPIAAVVIGWALWGIVAARPDAAGVFWTAAIGTIVLLGAIVKSWPSGVSVTPGG